MKRYLIFLFSMFLCINLFSQTYSEKTSYINPSRGIYFYKSGVYRDRNLDAAATSDLFNIIFTIYDENKNITYNEIMNNWASPGKELFITENALFFFSIPDFIWDGKVSDEYKTIRELSNNKAPEGEYQLIISIRSGKQTEPELFKDIIIIDETPPAFIPEYYLADSGKYIIFTEDDEEKDGIADTWEIQIIGKDTGYSYFYNDDIQESRLPVIQFIPKDEDCIVAIKATDKAKNISECKPFLLYGINKLSGAMLYDSNEKSSTDNSEENKVPKLSSIKRMEGERYPYLDIPDIYFPAYQSSCLMFNDPSENIIKIINLSNIIKSSLDEFDILYIHGFANPISTNQNIRERQNETIFKPLSHKRAEYIKNILILMGIPKDKIKVEGMGTNYIKENPFDNSVNYRNRIVKFYVK